MVYAVVLYLADEGARNPSDWAAVVSVDTELAPTDEMLDILRAGCPSKEVTVPAVFGNREDALRYIQTQDYIDPESIAESQFSRGFAAWLYAQHVAYMLPRRMNLPGELRHLFFAPEWWYVSLTF